MLNRTTCVFLKQKSGYVTPSMIHVRFHYSQDYDFTFVCFVSFMSDIQVQKSVGTGRHRTEDVLFFLCDDIDGSVVDVSLSCSKQLGLSVEVLNRSDNTTELSVLTIEDVCPTLSFERLKRLQRELDSSQSVVETTVEVDLNVIQRLKVGGLGAKANDEVLNAVSEEGVN
jgi:hypothetical protein